MIMRALLAATAVAAVSGCVTKNDLTSQPVVVETALGPVVCQLYTLEQTLFDTSVQHPVGMSTEAANEICKKEGVRILNGGAPVYAPVNSHGEYAVN